MKHYSSRRSELRLHRWSYVICFLSMLSLCVIRHSLAFLIAWEIMALSSFFLIIFESWKEDVIKAGTNFFIQSHVSVVLLTIGFIVMAQKTGSYDFSAIAGYHGAGLGWPFALILAGFAVKAGFVPFHTWLPRAHPAAPAHISGVMSGVIIKIGIYGILRMVTLFNCDMLLTGYIILAAAAVSGLYGVMLAIVQHNLKKLLAYHSIENIGIIGMGIGIGCIGLGLGNQPLAALGFGGALLHTLNHALFKSSLFFTAGSVYQAAHTLDVERLGGLAKSLPLTAAFFLTASVAICGLPPMNGFISELMIYMGMFDWMQLSGTAGVMGAAFAITALVMIGGLAILCFTKAFGIVFLGTSRTDLPQMKEFGAMRTAPLAIMAVIMLSVGIFPQVYTSVISNVLSGFGISQAVETPEWMSKVGMASLALTGVVIVLLLLRKMATRRASKRVGETWGCGYTAATPKIQYTATSFVRTYASLFTGLLGFSTHKPKVEKVFPEVDGYESENYDKLERNLIERPLDGYRRFMDKFSFLQNGRLQYYILYGILCIVVAVALTFIFA
ncbi:MAG: hypothetical protein HUJ93_03720 [Bacteroidales bacterium]|nr:hypothetical protein [Bacteroidales bacterium]